MDHSVSVRDRFSRSEKQALTLAGLLCVLVASIGIVGTERSADGPPNAAVSIDQIIADTDGARRR